MADQLHFAIGAAPNDLRVRGAEVGQGRAGKEGVLGKRAGWGRGRAGGGGGLALTMSKSECFGRSSRTRSTGAVSATQRWGRGGQQQRRRHVEAIGRELGLLLRGGAARPPRVVVFPVLDGCRVAPPHLPPISHLLRKLATFLRCLMLGALHSSDNATSES